MILTRATFDWTFAAAILRPFHRARPVQVAPSVSLSARELAEALRDSGLAAEDLLGAAPEAGVPFFLRPGFGERQR